jgi:ribosomal protein S18 acetylase RimI-like enzyme
MPNYKKMVITDIILLAWFHATLKEDDKKFYHPCPMSFFPALKFMWQRYHESNVVAKCDGEILGFAFIRHGELGIVVNPNYRTMGIGHKLTEFLIAIKPDLWLKVDATNKKAIGLYKSCGFKITGEDLDRRGRKLFKMERN